ncbi:acyl-CoA dehydrogenase family protein [Bradyrhizobium elkanii]|uniref:acyl-CoA dehydrogenase family protein n=1 Tax=Bradyrhizobium elkanii TaxID=29448 RepID=UPI001BA80DF5|nr:acyl-CoA dehydrogenase family protein [Bradyrhizobium elkanii]MBR1164791.1 acyl-CoA dehydrogenase family protein [Bradyrhizobium elkanii]
MDFKLTESQRQWRDEIRVFLRDNVTPELRREIQADGLPHEPGVWRWGPEALAFRAKVKAKGWFGLTWPLEYGGLGKGPIEQHIFMTEFDYAHITGAELTATTIGPMIMRYGTEENKRDFLPAIARGEFTTALGYSEPNAGTDLASLRTRADLDGEEWVINGSKIWNSQGHTATHEWLCVRTDFNAPKHRGISVIIVPLDAKGIEVRPLIAWSGYRTNQVFFTDVRVPRRNLIGEVNKGWQYITGALDLERGAFANAGDLRREVDDLIEICRGTSVGGRLLIHRTDVQRRIAELDADLEVAQLLGLRAASQLDDGESPATTMTVQKIYASELKQKIADFGMQIFGMYGQLSSLDPDAPGGGAIGALYKHAPVARFGGGTNEILRDAIAQREYGMPSYGRTKHN